MKILAIVAVLVAIGSSAFAAKANPPVNQFLGNDAVLSTYYNDFLKDYGRNYDNKLEAFRQFCRTLRTSDMLTEQMIMVGLPVDEVYKFLQVLEAAEFAATNEDTREAMLVVDFALESLESFLGNSHRREFRREVLAQVPPMIQVG